MTNSQIAATTPEADADEVAMGTDVETEDRGDHHQPEQYADANPHGDSFSNLRPP